MDYIGNKLDQGPMVAVVFRAAVYPVFRCLFFIAQSWRNIRCDNNQDTPNVYIG